MLKKLIKNELSATVKAHLLLLLGDVALTLFASVTILIVGSITDNQLALSLVTLPSIALSTIFFYVILSFPIFHAAWRFYKNLASDEGYLMHMLPTPTWMLVFSKTLISFIWTLVCSAVGGVCFIITQLAQTFALYRDTDISIPDIGSITELLRELFGEAFQIAPDIAFIIINLVLIIIFSLIFSILMLYLSIAIGQLWTAHRILGSILAYFAINSVLSVVSSVGLIVLIAIGVGSLTAFNVVLALFTLITAAACVAFYVATVHIFKTKLNLQ